MTRRGSGRQRHVSTRFLWLQDKVSKGDWKVVKVGTADQLADFLTKPVTARWLAEKSPEPTNVTVGKVLDDEIKIGTFLLRLSESQVKTIC